MRGRGRNVVASILFALVPLTSGCGHELVRPTVEPAAVNVSAPAAGPKLRAPLRCVVYSLVNELERPDKAATERLVASFLEVGLDAVVELEPSPSAAEARLEARVQMDHLTQPTIYSSVTRWVFAGITVVFVPLLFIWTDWDPALSSAYVLDVSVRGERVHRYEAIARGTIAAQTPEDGYGIIDEHRQTLQVMAFQSLASRFAADTAAREQLVVALDETGPRNLPSLLVVKETFPPRARWRTRKLIAFKNAGLPAILADAKTTELRDLVTTLESYMVDLTHEAEVGNDAAALNVAAGSDAQTPRELSLVYRERLEVVRPMLASVKEELEARSR